MSVHILKLSDAQLRCVNAALALFEAEKTADEDNLHGDTAMPVLGRTRRIVWDAMGKAGIEP